VTAVLAPEWRSVQCGQRRRQGEEREGEREREEDEEELGLVQQGFSEKTDCGNGRRPRAKSSAF
jgi:hypothetical protein